MGESKSTSCWNIQQGACLILRLSIRQSRYSFSNFKFSSKEPTFSEDTLASLRLEKKLQFNSLSNWCNRSLISFVKATFLSPFLVTDFKLHVFFCLDA